MGKSELRQYWGVRHRGKLLFVVAVVTFVSASSFFDLAITQDIASMLPDKNADFKRDFELFSYAPLARHIVIDLERSGENNIQELINATAQLSGAMKGPFFLRVVSGVREEEGLNLLNWIYDHYPCLFTEKDAIVFEQKMDVAQIEERLKKNIELLNSPESIFMKEMLLRDPLALRETAYRKLRYLSLLSNMELYDGCFISKDQQHSLIIAESSVSVTDFEQSRIMLDELNELIRQYLPQGINARVICAHRYTVANASVIQRDLIRVLLISTLGLVGIFLIFLRSFSSLYVFLIPFVAFLVGVAATSLVFNEISAITLGFGAVLLGISVDFGLHVYFALRQNNVHVSDIMAKLFRPLLFCALTTIAVFGVMLFSALPGQRQLAVFAITGITTAFLLSMLILPALLNNGRPLAQGKLFEAKRYTKLSVIWLILLLFCIIPACSIGFDGNLRNVGVVPEGTNADEQVLKDAWGHFRDQALVFTNALDLQGALSKNDMFFAAFTERFPDVRPVNLASIVPSLSTQADNMKRWVAFWQDNNRQAILNTNLVEQGRKAGFRANTFTTFFEWLNRPIESFTPNDFMSNCNREMIEPFLIDNDTSFGILSLVPDTIEMADYFDGMETEGISFVSGSQFSRMLSKVTINDFMRFLISAIIATVTLLSLLFLDFKKVVLCLLPVVSGIIVMVAIMVLTAQQLNIFNIVAAILVTGLGVDYGIFILNSVMMDSDSATSRAVIVSALTTFVGFGALITARHPAMHSIGTTVAFGILPAGFCAVVVLPTVGAWLKIGKDVHLVEEFKD